MLKRRDFVSLGALALAGCGTIEAPRARNAKPFAPRAKAPALEELRTPPPPKPAFHVFSKMFQPPVTKGVDELCELMAKAGFDGIQWTVRPKGHVLPERAAEDLPRVVAAARKQGLQATTICTAITDGDDPASERLLKVAADCGFTLFRPGYYFYDVKKETFQQSMDRIRRGFASLARVAEKTGMKATYQNHSSWGPSVFGGLLWDIHACIRDLDPKHVGIEYDPMHAFFETNLSWTHGFELVAPWIGAVDLKDFRYRLSKKNPKNHAKFMCPAGDGVVPWQDVRCLLDARGVRVPYIVHFEYDFEKADLLKTVKGELDWFKGVFA